MSLNTQMVRQFRSVVEECARGEAFCGSIVARSLYETVLAVVFVLKPRVAIVLRPQLDGSGCPKRNPDGTIKYSACPRRARIVKGPSRSRRADLYVARGILSAESVSKKMQEFPHMAKQGRKDASERALVVAKMRRRIGAKWTDVLQRGSTYSGLDIATLTSLLEPALYKWYRTVYHIQSGMAHGVDALRHLKEHDDGTFRPQYIASNDEIVGTLQASVCLLLAGMSALQNHIGFGVPNEIVLNHFAREFHSVFK